MERLQIWAIGIVLLGYWIGALGFGVDSMSYGLCAASVGAENYLRQPPAAWAEIRRACHQAALRWPYTITFRFLAWPKED